MTASENHPDGNGTDAEEPVWEVPDAKPGRMTLGRYQEIFDARRRGEPVPLEPDEEAEYQRTHERVVQMGQTLGANIWNNGAKQRNAVMQNLIKATANFQATNLVQNAVRDVKAVFPDTSAINAEKIDIHAAYQVPPLPGPQHLKVAADPTSDLLQEMLDRAKDRQETADALAQAQLDAVLNMNATLAAQGAAAEAARQEEAISARRNHRMVVWTFVVAVIAAVLTAIPLFKWW